jgi:hypothetical protein
MDQKVEEAIGFFSRLIPVEPGTSMNPAESGEEHRPYPATSLM